MGIDEKSDEIGRERTFNRARSCSLEKPMNGDEVFDEMLEWKRLQSQRVQCYDPNPKTPSNMGGSASHITGSVSIYNRALLFPPCFF